MELRTPSASLLDIVPSDPRVSFRGRRQRRQHANQRGLARAVRPQQAEDFSFLHGEADVVHGDEIAEALREAFHFDGIRAAFALSFRNARSGARGEAPAGAHRLSCPQTGDDPDSERKL